MISSSNSCPTATPIRYPSSLLHSFRMSVSDIAQTLSDLAAELRKVNKSDIAKNIQDCSNILEEMAQIDEKKIDIHALKCILKIKDPAVQLCKDPQEWLKGYFI